MATIKSYTDISQSKTLNKILPLESADMTLLHEEPYETSDSKFDGLHEVLCIQFIKYDKPTYRKKYRNISYFPCWSLSSLLGVLPKIGAKEPMVRKLYYVSKPVERYICEYGLTNITSEYDNPIDACYEMILKLHELKML